jgi:hypothetical protein
MMKELALISRALDTSSKNSESDLQGVIEDVLSLIRSNVYLVIDEIDESCDDWDLPR